MSKQLTRTRTIAAVTLTLSVGASHYESAMALSLSAHHSTLKSSTTYSSATGLPNSRLTPGATDPAVTQSNIASTICVVGYTKTVRPPVSYTTPLKRKQLAAGYSLGGDLSTKDYEEDHLIPLAIGGHPTDVRNLWPEPRKIAWGATKKDRLENKLHLMVCSHQIALKVAQQAFATNWIAAYKKYVAAN